MSFGWKYKPCRTSLAPPNDRNDEMHGPATPKFSNDEGAAEIRIGVKEFECIGATAPHDHPHIFLDMGRARSEEHTSELQSLMRISYAVFCLKKKTLYKSKPT